MKKISMNNINAVSLILLVSLLTGCVDTEKNKLDNRVLEYWNHKINKEYQAAYEYLSPGWKSNEDMESYDRRMKSSRVEWKSVKLLGKECSETYLCTVTVEIEYEYMFKENMGKKVLMPSSLKENWLMQDNVWFHVPIKSKIKAKN